MKDLVYALRSLRRQPAFTLITMLTLVLGIGANTAVFLRREWRSPATVALSQPERLEYITSQFPSLGFNQFWVSTPEFVEFRDNNQTFSSVGAYSVGAVNLEMTPPTRPVSALVTPELMPTLGVNPYRGRWFNTTDSVPNAPPVAILSYELWRQAFGGNEGIVGQNIRINGGSEQVVGIMPQGFDVHDSKIEIWRPLTINSATFPNSRGSHFLYLVGRLKDGVTREQASADVERLLNQWRQMIPPVTYRRPRIIASVSTRFAMTSWVASSARWSCCRPRLFSCSSSRAPTSRTSSSRAPTRARVSIRCGRHLVRRGGSCSNSC
jgi:hypothetical protein